MCAREGCHPEDLLLSMLTSDMMVEISTQLFCVLRYYGEDPAGKGMAPLTKAKREN